MAHIFGSDLATLTRARAFWLRKWGPPEALEVVRGRTVETAGNKDVRLTMIADLQQAAVDQVERKAWRSSGAESTNRPKCWRSTSEPSYSLKRSIARLPGSSSKPTSAISLSQSALWALTTFRVRPSRTVTMTAAFLGRRNKAPSLL